MNTITNARKKILSVLLSTLPLTLLLLAISLIFFTIKYLQCDLKPTYFSTSVYDVAYFSSPSPDTLLSSDVTASSDKEQSNITVSTYAELKKGTYSEGTIVKTQGYRSPNDGGMGTYSISYTPTSNSIDDLFCTKLNNGMYANLIHDNNDPINVALYGIFPYEMSSDKINKLINIVKGKSIGLTFNKGSYYLDKPLLLASMKYYGNNTTFEVSDTYTTKGFSIIAVQNTTDDFNIELYNINFHWNICASQAFLGNGGYDSCFFTVYNTKHFVMDSCNFKIDNSSGVNKKATILWFKQPRYIQNVTIKNSSFINNSGNSLPNNQHLNGGCIWFSGTSKTLCPVENINITNCTIESSLTDEALSFWFCKANNVTITGGNINNTYCVSDNVVGFMDGIFTKINFNNVTYNINSPALYINKIGNLWGASHVRFTGCTFNLNSKDLKPYKNAISLFFFYHDKNGVTITNKSSIVANECQFNSKYIDSQYRTIVMTAGTNSPKEVYVKYPHMNELFIPKEAIAVFENAENCNFFYTKDIDCNIYSPYITRKSTSIKTYKY